MKRRSSSGEGEGAMNIKEYTVPLKWPNKENKNMVPDTKTKEMNTNINIFWGLSYNLL